jgi:hypothetical protein
LISLASSSLRAQSVFLSNTATSTSGPTFIGQSFTIPASSAYQLSSFSWGNSGQQLNSGLLYVLSQQYLGQPSNLNSGTPGFLAVSSTTADGAIYQFSGANAITLQPNTMYWAYTQGDGLTHVYDQNWSWSNNYAGGEVYMANSFSANYTATSISNGYYDTGFAVYGSAIPEPSTYAAWAGALCIGVIIVSRRRRATDTLT